MNDGRLMGSPSISSQHIHLNMRGHLCLMFVICDRKAWTRCHLFRPRDTALVLRQRVLNLASFASSSSSSFSSSASPFPSSPLAFRLKPGCRRQTGRPLSLANATGPRHRGCCQTTSRMSRATPYSGVGTTHHRARSLLYIEELDPYSYVP